jgi:hypothetical protein
VQRREAAHGETDDVRALDPQVVEYRDRIVARMRLRIAFAIFRDVGGRKAARRVGDAAEAAREEAHLRLPASVIACEFVDEKNRRAAAGFFVVEAGAVFSDGVRHGAPKIQKW